MELSLGFIAAARSLPLGISFSGIGSGSTQASISNGQLRNHFSHDPSKFLKTVSVLRPGRVRVFLGMN
eukprot:12885001-Prorocentrum_lima.AAC.1